MKSNVLVRKVKSSQGIKKVIVNNKLPCSHCGYNLDVSNFYKDKYSATGYRSDCKSCFNRYKRKEIQEFNSANSIGIIGIFLYECAYKKCKKKFTTKTKTKVFCNPKCRKRDWYEKNEQYQWQTTYKKEDK